MKRSLFAFGFLVASILGHSPVAWSQEKLERMHIGYSAQAGAFAPIWITKEAGLFKKNGSDGRPRANPCGSILMNLER